MPKKEAPQIINSRPEMKFEQAEYSNFQVAKIAPKKKKWGSIVLLCVTILSLSFAFTYYSKYKSLTSNSELEAQAETERLIASISKLMDLPANETPTVATISDKEKLKGQAFFAAAENGDVLFAYTTAMKAILYRPSTNRIINVAPISINQSQPLNQATKQGAPTSTTKIDK